MTTEPDSSMTSPEPIATPRHRRPPQNIVLRLDGTNDEIGKGRPSNPAKVSEMPGGMGYAGLLSPSLEEAV
jgi:hypothetical protein